MLSRVGCCFKSPRTPLVEAAQSLTKPTFAPSQSGGQGQSVCQTSELIGALLQSTKAADAQDWIHRAYLQLEAAAPLLRASIRLYIAREDGGSELLLEGLTTNATTVSSQCVNSHGKVWERTSPQKSTLSKKSTSEPRMLEVEKLTQMLGQGNLTAPVVVGAAAAVPLFCGSDLFGALLLTYDCSEITSPRHHPPLGPKSCNATRSAGSNQPHLLELQQLGLALSIALTPDVVPVRRLTATLSRLSASSSLRETIAELCEALSYHVRQRFLIDPIVRAALMAEADATSAFLLDVSSAAATSSAAFPHVCQQQMPCDASIGSGAPAAQQPNTASRAAASCTARTVAPWDTMLQGTEAFHPPTSRAERPNSGKSCATSGARQAAGAAACGSLDSSGRSALPVSPAGVAAACEAAGGSVVARPFQLSYSLLLRLQMQRPKLSGIAVRDCARLVQDVHQPSRDVCLLMGTAAAASERIRAVGSSHPPGPGEGRNAVAPGGSMRESTPPAKGGPGGHASNGSGGGASAAIDRPAVQSLALVGCDTGDGATLAFYVCFPHRLPGQLVEAVRDSCQRLLERVLMRAVAPKLSGDLAAELAALRRGTPGTFAIVQMPYSRMGSNLAPSTAPIPACDGSLLGSEVSAATTTTPTRQGPPAIQLLPYSMTAQQGSSPPRYGAGRARSGMLVSELHCPATPCVPPHPPQHVSAVFSVVPADGITAGCHSRNHDTPGSAGEPAASDVGVGMRTKLVGGGSESWGPAATCPPSFTAGAESCHTFLCSSQGGSGPQHNFAQQHHQQLVEALPDMLQRATSVIVVRDLAAAAERNCQQLDALVSSVRDSIAAAAATAFGCASSPVSAASAFVAPCLGPGGGGAAADAGSAACSRFRSMLHLATSEATHGVRSAPPTTVCVTGPGSTELDAADIADLTLIGKIGQGGGGAVFLAQMAGGLEVAVKLLEIPDSFDVTDLVEQFNPGSDRGWNALHAFCNSVAAPAAAAACDSALSATLAAEAARQQLRVRRCLLRSATELAMLTSISHPHIVQVYGVYSNVVLETETAVDGGRSYRLRQQPPLLLDETQECAPVCSAVCMTLCELGSLATALAGGSFPSRKAKAPRGAGRAAALAAAMVDSPAFGATLMKHMKSVYLTLLEVALALRYLHGRHIVHRDLKPGNILLKCCASTPGDPRGFTAKIADFGLALVLDQEAAAGAEGSPAGWAGCFTLQDQAYGTVDHMAPESCRGAGNRITAAVDMYSFGIAMLEIVTGGRRPFGSVPPDRIGRLVMAGTRPIFPAWVPEPYRELAEACWSHEPQNRPTAAQVVVALRQQLQNHASGATNSAVVAGATNSAGLAVAAGAPVAPVQLQRQQQQHDCQ